MSSPDVLRTEHSPDVYEQKGNNVRKASVEDAKEFQRQIKNIQSEALDRENAKRRIDEIRHEIYPKKDRLTALGSAVKFGAIETPAVGSLFFKHVDHALSGIEKWADKHMKKYLHSALYWMFGYKPMKSEIDEAEKKHKKDDAKEKWKEKEDVYRKQLERNGKLSPHEIDLKMLEREENYDRKIAEKEEQKAEKEKEKEGGGNDNPKKNKKD